MLMVRTGVAGWRVLPTNITANPDFVFPKIKLAIFVDGCFWHGCSKCYHRPLSNRKYWDAKVLRNKARDKRLRMKLRRDEWSVLGVWEHELHQPEKLLVRIISAIRACKRKKN